MQNSRTSTQQLPALPESVPTNYYSYLPVRVGIVFGLMGSLLIMALIALLTVSAGADIFLSSRVIASVLLGEGAVSGILPIILGTLIHLASGAVYGAIFAAVMPRMPRPFWIVAGLLFAVVIWVIAMIALPLIVQPIGISQVTYFNVLLISHLLFGLNLGAAGGLYGLLGSRRNRA